VRETHVVIDIWFDEVGDQTVPSQARVSKTAPTRRRRG
jgi:hypothetical protein